MSDTGAVQDGLAEQACPAGAGSDGNVTAAAEPDGTPQRPLVSSRDLGHRRRADEWIRLAQVAGGIGLFERDFVGNVTRWSPEIFRIYGYGSFDATAELDLDYAFEQHIHPDDRPAHDARRQRFFASTDTVFSFEFRIVRKDGAVRWILSRGEMQRDASGRPLLAIGINMDITPRKADEAALRASEERLRFALEAANAGAWESRPETGLFIASERALALHGMAPAAPISHEIALAAIHADDRPKVLAALENTLSHGVAFDLELRVPQDDGTVRWLQSKAIRTDDRSRMIGLVQDITENKGLRDDLRKTTRRFELALANSPVTLFEQDLNLHYNWIFNAALGYSVAEIVGKSDADIMDPVAAEVLTALKRRVIETGRAIRQEVIAHAPGNPVEHFDLYVEPRRNDAGDIIGVTCAAVDISERKRVAQALAESDAKLQLFVDHAPAALAMFDTGMRYLAASRRWLDDYGLDRAPIGRNHYEMFPEIGAAWKAVHRRCLDGAAESSDGERFERADGSVQWVKWECRPWFTDNGGVGGLLIAAEDVTEGRRTEEALRESEERLRFALTASRAGVWTWMIETGDVVWSPQNFELYGLDPAQGPPTLDAWERLLHPDDVATTNEAIKATVEGRVAEFRTEFRVVHPSGEEHWLLGVGNVERGSNGKPLRLTGLNLDITARKRAEELADAVKNEVNHRAKNMLAVVQAVARQSAAHAEPSEFAGRFGERLSGLAASHDLLVRSDWRGVEIGDLVRSQLAHLADSFGARITFEGSALQVTAAAAQAIGMALHELATNAGKHGALSGPAGSVRIEWELAGEGAQKQFAMRWSELNGPPCAPPQRRGFGHTVIVDMAEHALDAQVSLTYPASGLVWRLSTAAARVLCGERG